MEKLWIWKWSLLLDSFLWYNRNSDHSWPKILPHHAQEVKKNEASPHNHHKRAQVDQMCRNYGEKKSLTSRANKRILLISEGTKELQAGTLPTEYLKDLKGLNYAVSRATRAREQIAPRWGGLEWPYGYQEQWHYPRRRYRFCYGALRWQRRRDWGARQDAHSTHQAAR